MRERLRYYFTFSGRISRRRYFLDSLKLGLISFVSAVLSMVVTAILALLIAAITSEKVAGSILQIAFPVGFGCFLVAQTVASFSLTVRRLHDLNCSAWWLLASFILNIGALLFQECGLESIFHSFLMGSLAALFIFANLLTTCVVLFFPGTEEANRFGENPKRKKVQNSAIEVPLA